MELRLFPRAGPFFCRMLEDLFLPIMRVKKKVMAGSVSVRQPRVSLTDFLERIF